MQRTSQILRYNIASIQRYTKKLVNKFALCSLQKYITIDESLLLYKGRLDWVQYLPRKELDCELSNIFYVNIRVDMSVNF